jgi:hypothetical protein
MQRRTGNGGAGGAGTGPGATGVIGGNGGIGIYSTMTGSNVAYAGGGGGGSENAGGGVGGGFGGGPAGGVSGIGGNSGNVNTGGGGGGQSNPSVVYDGGSGGSGIIVVRYAYTIPPSYLTLTAANSYVLEGSNIIFTLTSTFANNKPIYYSTLGNVDVTSFIGGNTGVITPTSDTTTITLQSNTNIPTNQERYFALQLRDGSATGPVILTNSSNTYIGDTALANTLNVSGGTNTLVNGYVTRIFTTSGNLIIGYVPNNALTAQVLIVAGGGGGQGGAGGGGGGALLYSNNINLSSGTYTVTVGAGGTGAPLNTGTNGANTIFGPYLALGGGTSNAAGGSGGGSPYSVDTTERAGRANLISNAGLTAYGNPGGRGRDSGAMSRGGGGGGAGSPGQGFFTPDATTTVPAGNGGSGLYFSITGANVSFAGGGGGGGFANGGNGGIGGGGGGGGNNGTGAPGSGGSGGTGYNSGNAGISAAVTPPAGTGGTGGINSGGGGGAGGYNVAGGTGGSGIVVIRYQI